METSNYEQLQLYQDFTQKHSKHNKQTKMIITQKRYYLLLILSSIIIGLFLISSFYLINRNALLSNNRNYLALQLEDAKNQYEGLIETNTKIEKENELLFDESKMLEKNAKDLQDKLNYYLSSFISGP